MEGPCGASATVRNMNSLDHGPIGNRDMIVGRGGHMFTINADRDQGVVPAQRIQHTSHGHPLLPLNIEHIIDSYHIYSTSSVRKARLHYAYETMLFRHNGNQFRQVNLEFLKPVKRRNAVEIPTTPAIDDVYHLLVLVLSVVTQRLHLLLKAH